MTWIPVRSTMVRDIVTLICVVSCGFVGIPFAGIGLLGMWYGLADVSVSENFWFALPPLMIGLAVLVCSAFWFWWLYKSRNRG